jgi:4-hydroxyphenylpyruvate dioxygenase
MAHRRRQRPHLRHRFRISAGRRPHPEGAGFHTIDHLTHNVYGGRMKYWADFYETHVQLPRNPLLRHQGRIYRPHQQGDDRARRQDPHPAERRRRGREGPDRGVPARLQRRGHPAHRLICDDLVACWDRLKARHPLHDRAARDLLRDAGRSACPAMARMWPRCKMRGILLDGTTEGRPPRLLLQIFAQKPDRPGVLRIHPAQGRRGLRRGQLQGAVRKHGARPDHPRRGAACSRWSHGCQRQLRFRLRRNE